MFFPVYTPWDDRNTFPLVINAVPVNDFNKRIPFTLNLDSEMNVVITGIEEINLPMDYIYVYDLLNDTYQEITGNNSANFFLEQGTYEDRFFVVFTRGIDSNRENEEIANEIKDAVTFFQNNPQTQLEVANPEGYDIKNASIFDMRGRLVLNKENLGDSRRLTFPTGTFSDGIYLVILTTSDNVIIDYKIAVQNR